MRLQIIAGFVLAAFQVTGADPCPKLKPAAFLDTLFQPCRPAPVSEIEKDRVLRSLPSAGEVKSLNRAEQRKLAAVDDVLRLHERAGVYTVKVVDVDAATTALHGRTVLLITHSALALLSVEELQALVAHEIGHEYVWGRFDDARDRGDNARLRELELICDTIAVETLWRLNIPVDRLFSALRKIAVYNQERLNVVLNSDAYPSLSERRSTIVGWRSTAPKP